MSDFALTSPEPEAEAMPVNTQLMDWDELAGHEVLAAIDNPNGPLGSRVQIVIITKTGCWLAFGAKEVSCHDEPVVEIDPPYYTSHNELTLADYLSPQQLKDLGLVNEGVYQALLEKEAAKNKADREAKAERLRNALAQLEKSA